MDIFTIGHSTHSWEKFIKILKSFNVEVLADVRSYPGSRYLPHFNKENMQSRVPEIGIEYIHMPKLGGRRRKIAEIDSVLTEGWTHIAFRNYAAYTLTEDYCQGLNELINIAASARVCLMCAESVPWKCHRLLLSNSLSFKGFCVHHIMEENKSTVHEINKYGAKAVLDKMTVIYPKSDQPI